MSPPRPGRARPVLLCLGLLVALGGAGYLAYRSPWVRSLFGRDAENAEELAKLDAAKLAVAPPADTGAGWPQWRGPMRDGRAPAGPLRTNWAAAPPTPVWSAPCGGGYSSLAVVGGRVYGHDRTPTGERVFCLDAATGRPLWEHPYDADYSGLKSGGYDTGLRATPTVAGGRVYAVGATGKFVCLEEAPAGGPPRLVKEYDLLQEFAAPLPTWGVACSPLVEGELVIVQPGGKGASVVALDRATLAVRWKAASNPPGYSSPVAATVGGMRVVYAFAGDALLCVRAADGEVLASYPWKTEYSANTATPVVVDDYVFISSAYSKGCALLHAVPAGDRVRLDEVYARNNRVLRTHLSTAVYRDGYLYGFDGTRTTTLACANFRKGTAVADWDAGGTLRSGTLILADRHLIVFTERGELGLVEATPDEFRLVATVKTGLTGDQNWALPVLVDGRLYLRGADKIICLDVRP